MAFGDDRKPLKRRAELGRARIGRGGGSSAGAQLKRRRREAQLRASVAFRLAVIDGRSCAWCRRAIATDPHHLLGQQHVRSFASTLELDRATTQRLLDDPANGLGLCHQCHWDHHYAPSRQVPRRLIPEAAWAFAIALGGEQAIARLERDYPDDQEVDDG